MKAKYDAAHRRDRATWAPLVQAGIVECWRCETLIPPDEPWHLGHRPGQESHPEHQLCNLRNSNEGRNDHVA